jgi:hypothetical protein
VVILPILGYAGSALWGALIYLLVSASAKQAKAIALGLGLLVVQTGLLWVRDWVTPWILLTIVAMFLLAYRYGRRKWTHRFVAFVGLYVLVESLRSPFHLLEARTLGMAVPWPGSPTCRRLSGLLSGR